MRRLHAARYRHMTPKGLLGTPWAIGLIAAALLLTPLASAGEEIIQGTVDGEARTWERFGSAGDGPAFFADLPANARLYNLHGFEDGASHDPQGSMLLSVSKMGERVASVELGYYEESRTGPDYLANQQVGQLDYEFETLSVENDTARITGRITGELHFVEDALREEYDESRTRSVDIVFDTTLPRQE